jgi:hypothetical protein
MTMTIDQVRDAVRTEPVRRLVEAAPSSEDVRHMIGEGLEALGDGLGSVADQVDRSAEAIRERIAWAEQLARPAPVRRTPWPAIALVSVIVAVAFAVVVSRIPRSRWSELRSWVMGMIDPARRGRIGDDADATFGVRAVDGRPASQEARRRDDIGRDLHAIPVEAGTADETAEEEGTPLGSRAAGLS